MKVPAFNNLTVSTSNNFGGKMLKMNVKSKEMKLLLGCILLILAGCSPQPKSFSSVKIGMSSREVVQSVGEPDKKQSIGVADLWTYTSADRTLVLRRDTVYDVITSANARVDSIKTTLGVIGNKVETEAEKAAKAIKKGADKAGTKIDSLIDKRNKKQEKNDQQK